MLGRFVLTHWARAKPSRLLGFLTSLRTRSISVGFDSRMTNGLGHPITAQADPGEHRFAASSGPFSPATRSLIIAIILRDAGPISSRSGLRAKEPRGKTSQGFRFLTQGNRLGL